MHVRGVPEDNNVQAIRHPRWNVLPLFCEIPSMGYAESLMGKTAILRRLCHVNKAGTIDCCLAPKRLIPESCMMLTGSQAYYFLGKFEQQNSIC